MRLLKRYLLNTPSLQPTKLVWILWKLWNILGFGFVLWFFSFVSPKCKLWNNFSDFKVFSYSAWNINFLMYLPAWPGNLNPRAPFPTVFCNRLWMSLGQHWPHWLRPWEERRALLLGGPSCAIADASLCSAVSSPYQWPWPLLQPPRFSVNGIKPNNSKTVLTQSQASNGFFFFLWFQFGLQKKKSKQAWPELPLFSRCRLTSGLVTRGVPWGASMLWHTENPTPQVLPPVLSPLLVGGTNFNPRF